MNEWIKRKIVTDQEPRRLLHPLRHVNQAQQDEESNQASKNNNSKNKKRERKKERINGMKENKNGKKKKNSRVFGSYRPTSKTNVRIIEATMMTKSRMLSLLKKNSRGLCG